MWRRYLGLLWFLCIPVTLAVVLVILSRQNKLVRWLRMLVGKDHTA
jgi:hypothetical protein